jgi:hypothetical protein
VKCLFFPKFLTLFGLPRNHSPNTVKTVNRSQSNRLLRHQRGKHHENHGLNGSQSLRNDPLSSLKKVSATLIHLFELIRLKSPRFNAEQLGKVAFSNLL